MAEQILGMKLRDYILLEKIARGNFGVVFKAKKITGNSQVEHVAIKRLEIMKNRKQTKRELQIADHLSDHDHLVSVIEYFFAVDKPRVYLVMEYCDGGNLNDHIIKQGPTLEDEVSYMLQIAKAVSHLHFNKVIHRDIKPENILLKKVGESMRCKLGDFSVSRLLTEAKFCETICGTFHYVAPEILDGKKYLWPADVFSLGILYFVMHTRYITKDQDKDILHPYIKHEGKKVALSSVVRRGKLSKSALIRDHFAEFPDLGNVIYHMLDDEPKRRPEMLSVVAEIAEIKGSLRPRKGNLARQMSDSDTTKKTQRVPPKQYFDSGLSSMEDEMEDGEIKVLSANQIDDEDSS